MALSPAENCFLLTPLLSICAVQTARTYLFPPSFISRFWARIVRKWHRLACSLVQSLVARLPLPHGALLLTAAKFAKCNLFRDILDDLAPSPPPDPDKAFAPSKFFRHRPATASLPALSRISGFGQYTPNGPGGTKGVCLKCALMAKSWFIRRCPVWAGIAKD